MFGLIIVKMSMISRASALVYTVRIPGFHPGGPGSIPGCGIFLFLYIILKMLMLSEIASDLKLLIAIYLGIILFKNWLINIKNSKKYHSWLSSGFLNFPLSHAQFMIYFLAIVLKKPNVFMYFSRRLIFLLTKTHNLRCFFAIKCTTHHFPGCILSWCFYCSSCGCYIFWAMSCMFMF